MSENQFFKPSENERFSCDLRYRWSRRTFADGYYQAATQLVAEATEHCALFDSYGPPIAFLFRHYVELMLKDIRDLQTRVSGSLLAKKTDHNLEGLWSEIKSNLDKDFTDRFNGVRDELDETHPFFETEMCIQDYAHMDPGGDAFRYPDPKIAAKKTVKSAEFRNQRTFDVVHLAKKMVAVEYFLTVLRGHLVHQIEEYESLQ